MAEFTSEIKTVSSSDKNIYDVLSDLRKLDLIKDKIPQDELNGFSYDQDSCTVNVSPIGDVRFVITNREPNSTIKFDAEKLPFNLNLWVQLEQVAENDTKMKLTINADLNPFLKPMVSKPLQDGLEKMATLLANIPYNEINQE